MKNIFISDMDGTLLKNDATLSDFSRNALIRMINEGLNFTVASARSVVNLKLIQKTKTRSVYKDMLEQVKKKDSIGGC